MAEPLSKSAKDGLQDLLELSSELGVAESTKDRALSVYRQSIEGGASGRRISDIVGACLLLGARQNNNPIDVCGVVESCGSKRKSIFREKRRIKQELNLSEKPLDVAQYVEKYSDKLELCENTKERANELINESKENGFSLSGKNPRGIAAAGVYLAGLVTSDSKNITQPDVVEVSGVTEVTIRSHYTKIAEHSGVRNVAESEVESRSGG